MKNMEDSLRKVSDYLTEMASRREKILKESRDAILASSRAIVSTHTGNLAEAKRLLKEGRRTLSSLRNVDSDLERYLVPAETEYVEALVLLSLVSKEGIPPFPRLKVSAESYILGLLDSVGEIRRLIVDTIRRGDSRRAEGLFESMEWIYLTLSPFAVHDHVLRGVRRKLDVARMLVEETRSAITEEVRRASLKRDMERLAKRLKRV